MSKRYMDISYYDQKTCGVSNETHKLLEESSILMLFFGYQGVACIPIIKQVVEQ